MKSGLPIIEPELKAPFAGDLLNRGGCALVFRSIVETFGEECVISLNGKWGTGKTTFLAMWEKYMENFGYKVIHFNSSTVLCRHLFVPRWPTTMKGPGAPRLESSPF